MPDSAIAADIHETLDVHGDLASERPLDLDPGLNLPAKTIHIVVGKILCPDVEIDASRLEDLLRACPPDPEDVGEGDLDPLVPREVNSCNTSPRLPNP
jgi:hypothetical protein